jgi:hypothetical protein
MKVSTTYSGIMIAFYSLTFIYPTDNYTFYLSIAFLIVGWHARELIVSDHTQIYAGLLVMPVLYDTCMGRWSTSYYFSKYKYY